MSLTSAFVHGRVLTKFPNEVDDLKEAHYSEEVREVVDLVFVGVSR